MMKFFYSNGRNLDGSLKMFKVDRTNETECEKYSAIEKIKDEVYKYYPTACTELKVAEELSPRRYQDMFHEMIELLRVENVQTIHYVSIQGSFENGTVNITHTSLIKQSVDISITIIGSSNTVLDADSIEVNLYKSRDNDEFKYFVARIPVRCYTVRTMNRSDATFMNPILCVEDSKGV